MARRRSRTERAARAAAKKHPKAFLTAAVLLAVFVAVCACLYFFVFKDEVDNFLAGLKKPGETDGTGTEIADGDLAEISSADLSIHFLELGVVNTGDCTLIKVGNTEVLIDAGAKKTSAPTQIMRDYVAKYCTDGVLEYVIATHAHEDHIAGFVGQEKGDTRTGFLYQYKIGTIIQFSQHKTTSGIYNDYVDAVEYCREKGTKVYDALECTEEKNGAKSTYYLDEAQTISMNILYQEYYSKAASSGENNNSVCMLLTQELDGGKENNYLFTGDLEKSGEESLVENNPALPHCVLFKGGHHGSSTSSNDILLSKITPENIAICCCAGTYEYADKPTDEEPENYLNTFPTQEALDRMAKYTENIYVTSLGILGEDYSSEGVTSMNGDIVFYYGAGEGEMQKSLKLWCSNNTTILKETAWFRENRTWNGG